MSKKLQAGDLILVSLPDHQPKGREQEGRRPAIIVGLPKGKVRYPVILIAPLTTQFGFWVENNPTLYPKLNAGTGGLSKNSVVLLDQIRAVDVKRVISYLGSLSPREFQKILEGLQSIFNL
ncbi:type II toxin-antitoxin system PemK/MazF family toxin [Euhalothece natronophila Z-M001]|uniref:Type II toxin-antitoxin system PemK/MazF family toxin n=1 Tax=Euhalothece natronophila Z-M001 TaxID=522448 RepID=A0A5B8NML9_9CHRO|nr:type II toxin-antitoxin system PemK/MazF family toxin [Euhalothece natronophila]QDZ40304.1 type II toxin-antitoxin system PemK/MazF family toxin [Euhalothece natronophila Z-M001]